MSNLEKLQLLVRRLRRPDGCPWDREQSWGDVRAYLLEEAHEVAAALDREDWPALRGELGDLLFQVCFVVELAKEDDLFELGDVIDGAHHKMVSRHPHVFGGESLETSQEVRRAWERRKLKSEDGSLLSGVPASLPALVAAFRLGQKAAGVGFDWSSPEEVLEKVEEEMGELRGALSSDTEAASPGRRAALAEELGDLLFSLASLARHLEIDPERALALANLKFRRRFRYLEQALGERLGERPDAEIRQEMESLWQQAKGLERSPDEDG